MAAEYRLSEPSAAAVSLSRVLANDRDEADDADIMTLPSLAATGASAIEAEEEEATAAAATGDENSSGAFSVDSRDELCDALACCACVCMLTQRQRK